MFWYSKFLSSTLKTQMMGDGFLVQSTNNCSKENPKKTNANKKKKKKRGGANKRPSLEQTLAYKSVSEWVFLGQSSFSSAAASVSFDDDFGVLINPTKFSDKLVFDLHSHSICSDGFLSPSKLVERAHQNGVSFSFLFCFLQLFFCNNHLWLHMWNGFLFDCYEFYLIFLYVIVKD